MTEAQNQPPQTPFDQPSADGGLRQLKSAQTLVTVATIAGPLSLLIGGVVLSGVGVICALMAFVKTRRVIAEGVAPGSVAGYDPGYSDRRLVVALRGV